MCAESKIACKYNVTILVNANHINPHGKHVFPKIWANLPQQVISPISIFSQW